MQIFSLGQVQEIQIILGLRECLQHTMQKFQWIILLTVMRGIVNSEKSSYYTRRE